jgi:hypothetical protein
VSSIGEPTGADLARDHVDGSDSPLLPVLALDAPVDPSLRVDPSTSLPFPISLSPPSLPASSPALALVGLGVRTVSFLKVKVYSVGFYTAASARELEGVQGVSVGNAQVRTRVPETSS